MPGERSRGERRRALAIVAVALGAFAAPDATNAQDAPVPRMVVVEPHASRDVAEAGPTVALLVRSMLKAPGLEVTDFSPPEGAGKIASALAYLGDGPGWILVSEVARHGTGLRASVRLIEHGGKELGGTSVLAGDGDVTTLARGIAKFVAGRTASAVNEAPAGSTGTLRAFVRAAEAKPGEASRILATADSRVAGPVSGARDIAASIWKDEARPAGERMDAALVGLATDEAIAMADAALARNRKDAHAASVKARALVGRMALDDAAAVLAPFKDSTDQDILLARAELAHYQRDPAARDAALAPLLQPPANPGALALVASLPPDALSPELEKAALAAAPADDPRLRSALGLRAAQGSVDKDGGLALISTSELDGKEVGSLGTALDGAAETPAAARLRAEVAMRGGDKAEVGEAVGKLAAIDPDADLTHLYKGRSLAESGDLKGAAEELGEAKEGMPGVAGLELNRVIKDMQVSTEARNAMLDLALEENFDGLAGQAMEMLDQGKPREALEKLKQAQAISPANPEVARALAKAHGELGQTEEAEEAAAIAAQLESEGLPVPGQPGEAGPSATTEVKMAATASATVVELGGPIRTALAGFEGLPGMGKVVVAPLAGSGTGFFAPRKLRERPVRDALIAVLGEPAFGLTVVDASGGPFAEPLVAADLIEFASSAGAAGVVLYSASLGDEQVSVKLMLFSVAEGKAHEARASLPSAGLVAWNPIFVGSVGGLLGLIVAGAAFFVIRGSGDIKVVLKLDPEAREEALGLIVSKSQERPAITDPTNFRSALRAKGYSQRGRRAELVGPLTRFRKLPPGKYYVHLFGVYDRGGETSLVDERWSQQVAVVRGNTSAVDFDMVPKEAELRLKLSEAGTPAVGVTVWLNTAADKLVKSDANGDLRLFMPPGEHVLHIEGDGVKIERTIGSAGPTIERVSIDIERERRLQQIAGHAGSGPGGATIQSPAPTVPSTPVAPTVVSRDRAPVASAAAIDRTMPAPPLAGGSGALGAGLAQGSHSGAATRPSGPIAVGSSMLGRYDLSRELGRGAMGVVYKARDRNLDRDVALKLIGEEVKHHPQALSLFLQEAKALAQLNHPNIVAVYDQSEVDGQPYMVMEFVDGTTLEHMLGDRGGKLPLGEALEMMDQLFAGLAYAHDRRVIHRDIKPANIFVSREGVVKIGDFGLARVMRELSLRKTEIRGTPLYMAPEQITGTNVSHRADLYAAGCTAFELMTGRPPFTDGDILYHHMHSEPPRPSALDPEIPAELDKLIMKCIAKDAEQRFESAHVIRERLRLLIQRFG